MQPVKKIATIQTILWLTDGSFRAQSISIHSQSSFNIITLNINTDSCIPNAPLRPLI